MKNTAVQNRLNNELSKGKSIAWWAMGYYISVGNEYSPSFKIPIFQFIEQSKNNTMVLIDYLGSMMWINCRPERVIYGNMKRNGELSPSEVGKELRSKLEALKS